MSKERERVRGEDRQGEERDVHYSCHFPPCVRTGELPRLVPSIGKVAQCLMFPLDNRTPMCLSPFASVI